MTLDQDKDQNQDRNLEIQKEILSGRKFSLAEVIGREGGDFLKGESPVPKLFQAIAEINLFISQNIGDSSGALQAVLQNWVKNSEAEVSKHLNTPLFALETIVQNIITNQELLYEFVRQVDVKWGQLYDERPYFQQPGQTAHPEDEYTHHSVHSQLIDFLNLLKSKI